MAKRLVIFDIDGCVARGRDGDVPAYFSNTPKEKDPGFGGLVRVQNKRQEFPWVHPQFEQEY